MEKAEIDFPGMPEGYYWEVTEHPFDLGLQNMGDVMSVLLRREDSDKILYSVPLVGWSISIFGGGCYVTVPITAKLIVEKAEEIHTQWARAERQKNSENFFRGTYPPKVLKEMPDGVS